MRSDTSTMSEDYLKVIYAASEWGGEGITVSGLASHMDVVASTASENVRKLVEKGYLVHEPYHGIGLTPTGRREALRVIRKHRLLETYLFECLDFDWDEVHEEADLLEHVASDRLIDHIDTKLGHPTKDPHGDPIPSPDGDVPHVDWQPLCELADGQASTVLRISDNEPELLRYLQSVGLMPGAQVTMVERRTYAGVYTLKVGEKSFDIGDRAVALVWVAKIEGDQ